ncbi:hypothetical protein [Burkholderia gladioli]|uniref:hypothetical protein n=1 Tax=Burkholderia gladioli TaxID=28095 RepID=UPI00163E0B2F|nr:hypothetical protein [Burkholderia gladioli]
MWYALCNRKEFSEFVLGGRPAFESTVKQDDDIPHLNFAVDQILLCWNRDPKKVREFPILAVVDDERLESTLGLLNSSPSIVSPFTSICRVISASTARSYQKRVPVSGVSLVLDAMMGLCFAEAIVLSEGQVNFQDLSPAICRRTLSFAWSKALSSAIPDSHFMNLIKGWAEAYAATSSSTRADSIREKIALLTPILMLAAELYYGLPPSNAVGELCRAIVQGDKQTQESVWKLLCARLPETASLAVLAAANREERGAYLQAILKHVYVDGANDELGAIICAFIATQIAPGSLQHMDFLATYPDSRLLLWYGFFALLQRPQGSTNAAGGPIARMLRDVRRAEAFNIGPEADISIEEFKLLARADIGSLAKKLSHANEIEIEVIPLVSCTFRYPSRPTKQQELFEAERVSSPEKSRDDVAIAREIDADKINEAIRILEQVASSVRPTIGSLYEKGATKRTRKRI